MASVIDFAARKNNHQRHCAYTQTNMCKAASYKIRKITKVRKYKLYFCSLRDCIK